MLTDIEAAAARTGVTLLTDVLTLLLRLFLVQTLCGLNGEITVLQLQIHFVLLEARQVDVKLIGVLGLTDVGLHEVLAMLAVQGVEAARHYHIKRIREEIIKQIFTIDAGQHKSYLQSLRPPPGETPVQPGLYYVPNVVVVLFPWGWVPVPSLKVQLHYTTVFSTVNRRALIFTQCTMFVHSPFIFTQFSAILQNSFSVKNRHNTVPARARGGHILRFFPAEAPHARRAGRYCLPRTPEFHRRSGTRPAGG